MPRLHLLALLLIVSGPVLGQTLYKSTGPDGKVIYSDRPPSTGKVEKTLSVRDLPNTAIPEKTLAEIAALRRTSKPAQSTSAGVVLFSASWCGYCRQAKAFLAQRGIQYREHDIDGEDGKIAFVQAGGGRGVPMLVVNGATVQGFSQASYEYYFPRAK